MSKVLVIGDPHLKVANQQLAARFLNWVQEMVELHKPDYTVNLGDTFHTHNVVRSEVLALVDDHLNWMNAKQNQYFILLGNHDMAHHKTPHIHAWLPYVNKHEWVNIITKPSQFLDKVFIPYIDSPTEFQQELNLAMSKTRLIFCHQSFRGANFGFIVAREGAQVPHDYPGQIVSGHIHKQQILGCVWYPGTPFAQEASDHNELKGIFLIDTITGEKTFLKSPLPQWVTSRATPADFQEVIKGMDKDNKNHLVIHGPGPEVTAAVDSKLFRDLKKEYGFSVKKDSTSSDKSKTTIRKVATVEDAVVEYIDLIYDGTVDKARLKLKCLAALQ